MAKKYPLPSFLSGQVPQEVYERWLRHKAQAHVKRDQRRGNKAAIGEAYRVAIHAERGRAIRIISARKATRHERGTYEQS